MELEITPPVEPAVATALADVLDEAKRAAARPAAGAWQRAALAEVVERDECYAFSPRSTRGATRA